MEKFRADLVTFTEVILNGKLHFLCDVRSFSGFYLFLIAAKLFLLNGLFIIL